MKPIVINGQSRESYDNVKALNWSSLKHLSRSPFHFKWEEEQRALGVAEDTPSRKFGRATHLCVLEPERFVSEVAVWPAAEGRRFGKKWDAFQAANKGKEIIKEEEVGRCVAIRRAVWGHDFVAKHLTDGRGEVSVYWQHQREPAGALPGFSFDCKGRLDWVSHSGVVLDFKTTRDGSPDAFGRQCYQYKYHTQAAWYLDGYEAVTGLRPEYWVVAVESAAPHVVQPYRVTNAVLEAGREEYRALLDRLHFCRTHDRWPGFGDGVLEFELPRWATHFQDDEDADGLGLVFGDGLSAAQE